MGFITTLKWKNLSSKNEVSLTCNGACMLTVPMDIWDSFRPSEYHSGILFMNSWEPKKCNIFRKDTKTNIYKILLYCCSTCCELYWNEWHLAEHLSKRTSALKHWHPFQSLLVSMKCAAQGQRVKMILKSVFYLEESVTSHFVAS